MRSALGDSRGGDWELLFSMIWDDDPVLVRYQSVAGGQVTMHFVEQNQQCWHR